MAAPVTSTPFAYQNPNQVPEVIIFWHNSIWAFPHRASQNWLTSCKEMTTLPLTLLQPQLKALPAGVWGQLQGWREELEEFSWTCLPAYWLPSCEKSVQAPNIHFYQIYGTGDSSLDPVSNTESLHAMTATMASLPEQWQEFSVINSFAFKLYNTG